MAKIVPSAGLGAVSRAWVKNAARQRTVAFIQQALHTTAVLQEKKREPLKDTALLFARVAAEVCVATISLPGPLIATAAAVDFGRREAFEKHEKRSLQMPACSFSSHLKCHFHVVAVCFCCISVEFTLQDGRTEPKDSSRTAAAQQDKGQQDRTPRTRPGQQESQIQQDSRTADSKTPAGQQSKRAQQQHRNLQHSTAGLTAGLRAEPTAGPTAEQKQSKKVGAKSISKIGNGSRTVGQQQNRTAELLCGQLVARVFVLVPAQRRHFWRVPARTRWFQFPAGLCTCLLADCFMLLAYLCSVFAACLPLSCVWLVSCGFVVVSDWWLAFCLPACTLPSGSFCAVSCLCLFRGSVCAAYLPVLCGLARFVPLHTCICLVACLLPLACLHCAVWLVSCRLVLVPASWLVLGACPPALCVPLRAVPASWLVLGACLPALWGLAGFAPLRALYLLRPALWGLAGFVPFRACTCFVAGAWRLLACSWWVGSFCAVSCLYLLRGWFLALACLHLGLRSFRPVSCLYLLRGSVLPLACV